MKRDILFFWRMSRLCRFPLKVSIQLFMGTLISAFVLMCVFAYSIFLDTELKKAISGIDGKPYVYCERDEIHDLEEIKEYCDKNESISGFSCEYSGFVAEYSMSKALIWKDMLDYTESSIKIDGDEYSFDDSDKNIDMIYQSALYSIAALYYDLDNYCEEIFPGKLVAGRYPEAEKEIMVTTQFLKLYGVDVSDPKVFIDKRFIINGKYMAGTKIVGVIEYEDKYLGEGIIIPTRNRLLLSQGQYYIYLNNYDIDISNKIEDDITKLTGADCYTSRAIYNYNNLIKQQTFMNKMISIAAVLVTAAAILNMIAQISFCITIKRRSVAIMMSMGMSFGEMHFIYQLNFLKLLFVSMGIAAAGSYFLVTRIIRGALYDLGRGSQINSTQILVTIGITIAVLLILSELLMAVIFTSTLKRSSEADCLRV